MTQAREVVRTAKSKGPYSGKITSRREVTSEAKEGISSFGHTFYSYDVNFERKHLHKKAELYVRQNKNQNL
jgi:hypothetical protein